MSTRITTVLQPYYYLLQLYFYDIKQVIGLLKHMSVADLILVKREIDQMMNNAGEKQGQKERNPGVLKGKVWMASDFNEPLAEFNDYME